MTILHLANARRGGFGGIQSFLEHLARACSLQDIISRIVSCPHEFQTVEEARSWGARYLREGEEASRADVEWLTELLETERPTLLHTHNTHIPSSPLIANVIEHVAERFGIPHVLTVHDVTEHAEVALLLTLLKRTHVVTQSAFNRDLLRQRTGQCVTVVPVGIPFDEYPATTEREPRTIAFPGRLTSHKVPAEAVAAFARARDQRQAYHFLFSSRRAIARGQTEAHIDQIATIVSNAGTTCEFLRPEHTPRDMYRRAAATVVMPVHAEGFGLVPLESLASGKPVIAAPTGGMREWIAGLPGVAIVDGPHDPTLPAVLRQIIRKWDAWSAAARASREQLQRRFDIEVVAERHLEYYHNLGIGRGPIPTSPQRRRE